MERNVLDYEPTTALFVPNDDPLRFYKAIADYAGKSLRQDGILYFEMNPLYVESLSILLKDMGFHDTEIKYDQYGKQRFIKAIR